MHTLLYLLSPIQRIQMPKSAAADTEDPVQLDPTRVHELVLPPPTWMLAGQDALPFFQVELHSNAHKY